MLSYVDWLTMVFSLLDGLWKHRLQRGCKMNAVVKGLRFDTKNDDPRTRGFVNKFQDWKNTKPEPYASEEQG